MSVASWLLSKWTGAGQQDPSTYKGAIDGNFAVAQQIVAAFAPQQQATANMTIQVLAGNVLDGGLLVINAAQNTGTIVAPVTYPRIDRVVIDQRTGAISVVTGVENASPVAPAIPAGKLPCAQILLQTTSTVITDLMIDDERTLASISKAYADATYVTPSGTVANATTAANGVPAGTIIDFAGTAAPAGYLACPTASGGTQVVSRTTYAVLFAAIGTTWGAGDGSTTFGIPWFPADYASVQAASNVGTETTGNVVGHNHTFSGSGSFTSYGAGSATGELGANYGNGTFLETVGVSVSGTVGTTGGGANLAAGVRILKCVKY